MRSALLIALLGGANALITGQTSCNTDICITGKHDDKTKMDTYTLAPPAGTAVGWMSLGFGSMMTNTPMVIVWYNPDGTYTLSHRQTSDYVMPTIVANPARKASFTPGASFANSTATSITFTLPSSNSSLDQTQLIWALSPTNPHSSWDEAKITQHSAAGSLTLNLLATLGSTTQNAGSSASAVKTAATTSSSATAKTGSTHSGESVSTTSSSSSSSSSSKHRALIAHAVCGALATMFLLPVGALVPRIARGMTTDRWWFPVHGAVNGVLGGALIVAAFAIARTKFHAYGGFDTAHKKAGLALFLLTLFQVALGMFTHWFKSPLYTLQTKSGRGPSNFLHMILGTVIIVLGWATVWLGLDEDWARASGTGAVPTGLKAGWGILVALFTLAYLIALGVFLPRQIALERQQRLRHAGITDPALWREESGKSASGAEMRTTGSQDDIWSGPTRTVQPALDGVGRL